MKLLLLSTFVVCSFFILGQDLVNSELNFEYNERPTYDIELGKKFNPDSILDHPEFGVLPYDKPYGKNVVEDLSKRSKFKRYYIDIDNPNYFYIQKSATPINYKKNGDWIAISPFLEKTGNHVYTANNQPYPTQIDKTNQRTSIQVNNRTFTFNNYSAVYEDMNGDETVHHSNWDDIEIGNRAVMIRDIFPSINMRMVFEKGTIKSEFIIDEELNQKSIRFTDQMEWPQNFIIEDTTQSNDGHFLLLLDQDGTPYLKINKVRSFDSSGDRQGWKHEYDINDSALSFTLDSSFIHNESIEYPLYIDPLITAVGPVNSAFGVSGTVEAPAQCSNTLNVTFPGGSTPWDVSATWDVYTQECIYWDYYGYYYPCYNSDAQVTLESSCGGFSPTPGNSWQCVGCNTPGTWTPTLPFNSTGTQSLAQCYSPSCSNQTMTFNLNINRASGCTQLFGVYDNCNWGNSLCVSLDEWSVTVQGRTVETLGNTTTGNGFSAVVATSCAGGATTTLDPTPEYGVPGYSFNWNTGETTPTIDITGPSTGDIFTADVTDACGNTVTATFEITCPLAVDLLDFTAENMDEQVVLNWSTASERDNDYFEVLRSRDGESFEVIGKVQGAGNSSTTNHYSFIDNDPYKGFNYYKLRIVDFDGVEEFSPTASVERFSNSSSILCVPNPANEDVHIIFNYPEDDEYELEIIDMMGRTVHREINFFKKGKKSLNVNVRSLRSGTYKVQIITANQVHSSRLIVQ